MEESEISNFTENNANDLVNNDINDTNDTNNSTATTNTTIIIPTSKIRKKHTKKINKNPTIKKARLVAKLGTFCKHKF